ncbi:hypothetical protein [Pyrodictium abyssi]|uniref:Uncharacterized protein n=1 Tax=Pyrodictium abyssi TaxID=54256 RepID=A0ABN6ZVF1_9CREN|nr:hypothetical protein PABY_15550 [Pyrodictium abyssi]
MTFQRSGLGLLLPSPKHIASPSRALGLVGELARAIAYTRGYELVAAPRGWWSRRLCPVLAGLECVGLDEAEMPYAVDELVEVEADSAKPRPLRAVGKPVLRYYIDSRRGRLLYLGKTVAAEA